MDVGVPGRRTVAEALQRSYSAREAERALHVSPERAARLLPPGVSSFSLADLVVLFVLDAARPSTKTPFDECSRAVARTLGDACDLSADSTDDPEELAVLIDANLLFRVTSMFEAITGEGHSPVQIWPVNNVLQAVLGRLDGSWLD